MTTRRRFVQLCSAGLVRPAAPQRIPNSSIAKAMESVRAAIPGAESDPERPVYHFHPPANWNNDPNGTIYYHGWHHLFYQHNPYGSAWGHMHWGHARSRDLVNWEHLPIALWPSEEKGEQHIFSGGAALARDGRPRLFYTSIGPRSPEQWQAIPKDDELIEWEKHPRNPVLTLAAHGALKIEDWRDPFLFQEAGSTYMVCGGNTSGRRWGGTGAVQLYRALNDELTEWKHLGPVFKCRDREVINIECPNLFKLEGKWVLLISPHKPCEYFLGELDLARSRFYAEAHGVLDAGTAYASNISTDDKGRTILWLWGKTETAPVKGWNNVMVLPRILSIGADGFLRQQPAREFESLRREVRTAAPASIGEKPLVLTGIQGDCLELEADFAAENAAHLGIEARRSEVGKAGAVISINTGSGMLSVGNARTLIGRQPRYKLRLFLDKRVLEVYVNEGMAALFTTVDAGPRDLGIAAFAQGGAARLESLKAWPMKTARFSLERFRV